MFPRTLLPSAPCLSHVPPGRFHPHYGFSQLLIPSNIYYLLAANHCALHMKLRHHISCSSPPGCPRYLKTKVSKTWLSIFLLKPGFSSCLLSWSVAPPTTQTGIILDFLSFPHPTDPQFLRIPGLNGSPSLLFSIPSWFWRTPGAQSIFFPTLRQPPCGLTASSLTQQSPTCRAESSSETWLWICQSPV